MADNPERVIYFAETDHRNKRTHFGIKEKDRDRHMYVIGKTGMGKSTLLENMAVQDIQNGSGLAFIDPHGGSAEALLDYVPEHRIKDVMYFAPFDMEYPISFNIMEDVGADKRHLVVAGLMNTFEKIWADAWSARMAYILQNTLLALLEFPGATLLGVNRMLTDKNYRDLVVSNIKDLAVRSFWVDEFAKYTDRYAAEATPAIQNKVGQFSSNPLIRNIIGQARSSFDIRKMMDESKIMIVNLSKGRVGEGNVNLLGGMLVTKIYLAAMSRADKTRADLLKLPSFNLYVDEFQSFANKSFADILSEARKYKLALTIAHQYVEQMEEEVRDAVLGNVGSTLAFRVGPLDAEILEKVFAPKFLVEDLVSLGRNQIYLSLMIDGIGSPPFSAHTLAPLPRPEKSFKEQILASSRAQFAHSREEVEAEIKNWHETDGSHGSSTPRPPSPPAQSFGGSTSKFPPRTGGVGGGSTSVSSTSGAAKRRKRNERDVMPSPRSAFTPPPNSNYQNNTTHSNFPPRPHIPPEAMKDLGSSNLKSLLEKALKEKAETNQSNNFEDENVNEDEESVYKPGSDQITPANSGNEENENDESEAETEPEQITQEKKEIETKELKKIFGFE